MADTTFSAISGALEQRIRREVVKQYNRSSVTSDLIPKQAGMGKNLAWDVSVGTSTGMVFDDGQVVSTFNADTELLATMPWCEYGDALKITGLAEDAAAFSETQLGSTFMFKLLQSRERAAQRINSERFWPKTRAAPGGCVVWTAAIKSDRPGKQQGVFGFGGGSKTVRSHRWIYEQALGPIPLGKILMHTCDNPSCVALQHLDIGTYKQNVDDMDRKGRRTNAQPTGEAHWKCKLSDAQVAEMRQRYANGERQADLAVAYGISRPHTSHIVNRKGRR